MSEDVRVLRRLPRPEPPAALLARIRYSLVEPVRAFVRTLLVRSEVQEIVRRPGLATAEIVAVMIIKDEAQRLPFLLDYYRGLEVDHFIVIDNRSSDELRPLLVRQQDVSLFAAEGEYSGSRFGNDWVNWLLRKHCAGKWVLWIDADEILVFSRHGDVTLPQLIERLEERGQDSLQALMLDMYSERQPHENVVEPGVDPLTVCDLYDRSGYERFTDPITKVTWIKGGVRARLFFAADHWAGPALNKSPLVKWRSHYVFQKSAHELWPPRLNGRGRTESVLLHYKFTAMAVEKMVDADVRKQHTPEYDAYSDMQYVTFGGDATTRLVDIDDLVENGLFEPVV